MAYRKKLIEVALPLEAINAESAREKSIRHGHPSTLHLWWARRPLASARAVIFTSLIDDPDQDGVPQALLDEIDRLPLPQKYKTSDSASMGEIRRYKLFGFIEELVKWENSASEDILSAARRLINAATDGNPPPLLDPFAGGGSIPLEAQRLGLYAHASDLNPVAVMINKAMIEIPPKFAGLPPVNPDARRNPLNKAWKGAEGLAADVRYYGEWMKQEAFKRIGRLYPKVKGKDGREHTVIAWIWTRTVKCPNPACGCEMPLTSSFVLSKKKGKEAYVQPVIDGKNIRYEVRYGKDAPEPPKTSRGAKFKCICCGESTTPDYIKDEAMAGRMGASLMAVVADGDNGRLYLTPDDEHINAAQVDKPLDYPSEALGGDRRAIWCPLYGLDTYDKLFTNRQLTALTTFSGLVVEAQKKATQDAAAAGMASDGTRLSDGGAGAAAYGEAVGVYLAFAVDRAANRLSSLCLWNRVGEKIEQTFGRQAIPMIWDFAEANVFSDSTGSWSGSLEWIPQCIELLPASAEGNVEQRDAQSDNGLRGIMVSTDPPYYDNIGFADLSDFFYIWLRQALKGTYPEVFRTMLVPKVEELVAIPYRFEGDKDKANAFFESGMQRTFKQINAYVREDFPTTVYYAYLQKEQDGDGESSRGWEAMLSAIISAGFSIVGTWPMKTERPGGFRNNEQNALASSIVLVCRKRPADAPMSTRRDFINALKRELKPALYKLQQSNIAPVDLAQSAIGPGMAVYSRYSNVLEADGTPMTVRSALQIINQELDVYFSEQEGELDSESRFCVALYMQNAFNDMKYGEAAVLAQAKNIPIDKLAARGVVNSEKNFVRLLTREEIPEKVDKKIIWLLTQQLTRAFENDGVMGVARIVSGLSSFEPELAKALAYRLYQIAERKGWAQEAYAYNSLVTSWPEIQSAAAQLQAQKSGGEQITFFGNN